MQYITHQLTRTLKHVYTVYRRTLQLHVRTPHYCGGVASSVVAGYVERPFGDGICRVGTCLSEQRAPSVCTFTSLNSLTKVPDPHHLYYGRTRAQLGALNAVSNIVPYSLMGQATPKSESGWYVSLLNTCQTIAQLVANLVASATMNFCGNVRSGIATGAVFGILGCFFIPFLRESASR